MFELAGKEFVQMAGHFGLTVSILKTKGLAMGAVLSEGDVSQVEGGIIEMVKDFIYLGSNLSVDGEATCEVDCWIAKASKAFGCLQAPIFAFSSY